MKQIFPEQFQVIQSQQIQIQYTNNDALFTQKYCATISFIPKFNQTALDDAYSQYLDGLNVAQNQVINRGNYLFFIDRSGSMAGGRINKAKQSLLLFLKSLPEDCNFNIISFGSTFRSLWSESKQYSQKTLEEAIKHVNNMEANMNGTEILKPLSQVVYNKQYGKSKSTTLNVFLLTDGEVEALPIIDLVKKNNQAETRVYTLGIGEGCSQFLIKRLAEVGNGKYQFVSDNEDINAKVIDLLEDSLTPYLKEFTLQSNVNNIAQIIPNPESVVCLKKNQELTIQVLFSIDQQTDNLQFTLSCFDPQDQKPIKYEVSLNLHTSQENEYFHKLATHKFITFYEDSLNNGENDLNFIKINKQSIDDQDIINTSITHQILSKKTAFVCEVCELEDNFKQQKNQKVYITQNKRENNVQQEMQKCSLSSRQIPLSYMPRSRPMSNCFKKQSCVQEFACKKKLSISKVADPSSEDEEDESKEDIKCTKELKQRKCQKKNYECDKIEAMIQEDSEVRKKEKSRSREKQMRLRGSFHQEEDLPKQQITQVYKIEYEQVISYAKADGAFEYDQMFEQKLNFEGWKNEQNYPQNIWLTLLALLYLDQFCSQNRKSWQLVYQKGIQFLQKNGVNYKQIKEVYLQKQLVQI